MDDAARATVTFTGSGVSVVGYTDEWSGIADIYVDGTLRGAADLYRAPGGPQVVVFTASGLGAGTHTLAVQVSGRRNPASGGSWIWVDRFDVTP